LLFKQCVVTAVNYGPLIDLNQEVGRYKEIDEILGKELKDILNIDDDIMEII